MFKSGPWAGCWVGATLAGVRWGHLLPLISRLIIRPNTVSAEWDVEDAVKRGSRELKPGDCWEIPVLSVPKLQKIPTLVIP